ncbi:MAG: hypothetical protein CMH55_01775 [Myxococcales bacterium]|nr:hypothetical protein [Myxococcales bacterium]
MKKILIFGLACGLMGCVHGRSGAVDTVLQDLPAEHLGAVVYTRDTAKFLTFLKAEIDAIEKIAGGAMQQQMQDDLGFHPLTAEGLAAAGLDPTRQMAFWLGGTNPKKPSVHGVLPLGNRDKFLTALDRILVKGSLSRGSPVKTAKGDWIGLNRTTGQRSEPAGGLLINSRWVILTTGERGDLQAFSEGPSVAQHPHLETLRHRSQKAGQMAVFMTPKWLEQLQGTSLGSEMPQAAALYADVQMTPGKEVFVEALSFSLPEALALQRRLTPKPVARVPSPKGAVLAATGTMNVTELFAFVKEEDEVAKVLKKEQRMVDAIEPVLAKLGTDFTFSLGVDGEPANPMILLGSLFARLDIAGGQPREALDGVLAAAKVLELPTDKVQAVEGGYDLFIPPFVRVRFRADDQNLTIAYGRDAQPDSDSALMKIAEGQMNAGLFDGAKVGRMVSKMVRMNIGPKIGALLQRYGSWETWSGPLEAITAGYGRLKITP